MKIIRVSPISGKTVVLDIPCSEEQYAKWISGTPIQRAMPNVSPEQRHFVITGMTPKDHFATFGNEEED